MHEFSFAQQKSNELKDKENGVRVPNMKMGIELIGMRVCALLGKMENKSKGNPKKKQIERKRGKERARNRMKESQRDR